mgnify:CR=1 FL=1
MKLTAKDVYNRLLKDDKIYDTKGQIRFYLGNVDIVVKQRDVVGNIMQEWLEGWLKKNDIDYSPNPNSQMPPDFYLNPKNLKEDLLEVKAFNYEATPGFDIADFNAYQSELIEKPYMINSQYLIFGYIMQEDGYVVIKRMWLKHVWEICRPMANWPLNLQIKDKVVHKIRPAKWYSSGKTKFIPFECMEDFVAAIDETVYQNPKTHAEGGEWLSKFLRNYKKQYGMTLTVPRWNDIKGKYIIEK